MLRSRLRVAALWLVGVGAGLALLSVTVSRMEPPELAERLAHLDANPDAYDTLFFGTSRVFRGVNPEEFDAQTAARGYPTRSFNLGFVGMMPHETNVLLRAVVARDLPQWRFAFVELAEWDFDLVEAARFTERSVYWHDWRETRSVLGSIQSASLGAWARFELAIAHFAHLGARGLRVGEGARAVGRVLDDEPVASELPNRGFREYTREEYRTGVAGGRRRSFIDERDSYADAIAAMVATNRAGAPLEHFNRDALMDQFDILVAAGIEPIFIIPPQVAPTPVLKSVASAGWVPAVFDLSDPTAAPVLFQRQNRFDFDHLNTSGARHFSRLLAERFAKWRESQ